MKKSICKVCGYVSLDGDTAQCPVCMLKNVFVEKEDPFKTPDFVAQIGETEKKHIPKLKIETACKSLEGAKVVHAQIGEIIHPMIAEHHILGVTFYLNNKFISHTILGVDANPVATLHLKDGAAGKVQVIENCNLHGRWFNEIEVK